ncbi:MAG TPA: CoA transferase [Acidimicrobiales bacterium]|jgi:crotonobetainyl-CoA:carnitine CoA-transferase CaiB-like acyl-CoA transferase|nr:CoA transferase [Acidimicrobiales bacterium]
MGALDGIRVLEAGLLVQGPQVSLTMLEWGAEVIKLELPGFGDQSRWLPISREDRRSPWFTAYNRGKRSMTIDLRVPRGQEVFFRLVERSDVFVSNFKPGTLDSWGVGYGEASRRNPRIIYAMGSSFGPEGPDAQREGADLSGQAGGGIISTTGGAGSDPSPVGATIADHISGQNLLAGVLAALYARERTGHGQLVETSLLGGQVWAQAGEITKYLMSGEMTGPANRGHSMVPGIYGMFATSDGWIAIVGVAGPLRDRFYETLGRPDLIERFSGLLYFEDDKAALWPILDEVFATKTTAEWCDLLGAAGLRFAPVRDHAAVARDPGIRINGYIETVDDPDSSGSSLDVVRTPVRFSDGNQTGPVRPPELGQHTEEVLLEAGYSWDDITSLSEDGVV